MVKSMIRVDRVLLVLAALAVAIGLLVALRLVRDDGRPAAPARASALEQQVFGQRTNRGLATMEAASGHDGTLPRLEEEPTFGPERLRWLQLKLGTTYAAITLAGKQLEYLKALERPTAEQIKIRDHVQAHVRELEQHAEAQRADIERFDINAPPKLDDDGRTGPPVTVSAALTLTRDEWNRLVSQHIAPNTTIAAPAWQALEHQLAGARTTLDAIKIPSGLVTNVQAEFVPVVDALMRREATADRAAAETMLAARWQEFITRMRALSAGPTT